MINVFRNLENLILKLIAASPRWLRYFYYLRFSLMLWFFPLVLLGLNQTSARSLTGGILVPETFQQYTCVGFFLISAGFTALIIARVVVINGEERFELLPQPAANEDQSHSAHNDAAPPKALKKLLKSDDSRREDWAVILAVVPSAIMFGYLTLNSRTEGVYWWFSAPGLLFGALLAVCFWGVVNILYYLVYDFPPGRHPSDTEDHTVKLGKNAARTILFPRRFFRLPMPGSSLRSDTLEAAVIPFREGKLGSTLRRLADRFVRRFNLPGYVYPGTTHPYEAQFFSIVSLFGFFLIYVVIWPLAAPVPTFMAWPMIALLVLVGALVIRLLLSARTPEGKPLKEVPYSVFFVVVFTFVFPVLYVLSDAERFPAFATILVAATMFIWTLAGAAFFLDRFRVPVFTLILLLIAVPRVINWDGGREEHYISITAAATAAETPGAALTPAEILNKWFDDKQAFDPDQPLIIVTATGGGLHASAWTAAVLTQLETQFKTASQPSFYSHILLMSTVSGGSTGLMNYLQAQRSPGGMVDPQVGAACSSLEAVGWGIIYHDLPASLFLPVSWIVGSSSGVDDLKTSPLARKDRTWALRKGFERNLNDSFCARQWADSRDHVVLSMVKRDIAEAEKSEQTLTLRTLNVDPRNTPAIVMNTTTAERGSRFLLSNYDIPRYAIGNDGILPAESFLHAFGSRNVSFEGHPAYPDLPLATAAQMSATFPYVSSAARFPYLDNLGSSHFIDGGYYDNDGTASILEFLRYALDTPSQADQHDAENIDALNAVDQKFRANNKHLRIILIEIRNSDDDPANDTTNNQANGQSAPIPPTNLLFQLVAPLDGFWNAGHASVTSRNRASLSLIEQAYADRLQVKHIVISDTSHRTNDANTPLAKRTDPLNWSLTPAQRHEVRDTSTQDCKLQHKDENKENPTPDEECVQQKYHEVIRWLHKSDEDWKDLLNSEHKAKPAATPAS